MNSIVMMMFSILSLVKAGMPMNGGGMQGGMMMQQQQPPKTEAGVLMNYLQNDKMTEGMYGKGDDCGAKSNMISDGIYFAKTDPMTEHLEKIQKQQQCYIAKAKIRKEVENKMKQIVRETAKKASNEFQGNLEKKNCVNKLDRSHHECFVKEVLKDFYTAVVWKVAIHDNVAQLWYHDKLVLMIVFETIEYNVKPKEKECFTFFPTSNVAAEENALGHVVNVIGKPATPKAVSSECRPCSDFLKGETVEGSASKCSNNCSSSNYLFSPSSSFKTLKPSTRSVPEVSTEAKKD